LTTWLVVAFTVALVALPVSARLLINNSAVWQIAVAERQYANGQTEEAISKLTQIADGAPNDIDVQSKVAVWMAENGQAEIATEIAEQLAITFPNDPTMLLTQSFVFQQSKDFEKAVEALEKLSRMNLSPDARIGIQNDLAYYRALADKNVTLGLAEIGLSISAVESRFQGRFASSLGFPECVLASVFSLRGFEQTTPLMEQSLDDQIRSRVEMLWDAKLEFHDDVTQLFAQGHRLDAERKKRLSELRESRQETKESLAMLLSIRAMVYQQKDQDELSIKDRRFVIGLGYEPSEMIESLPAGIDAMIILERASAYLDTKGFLLYRTKNFQNALHDADLSVVSALTTFEILSNPDQDKISKADLARWNIADLNRQIAVLRYHRMLVLEELDRDEALAERLAIKQLGFEPNEDLH